MGKGKGHPEEWVAVVKPARILYELEGVSQPTSREEAMRLAVAQAGIKTRFISRHAELARRAQEIGMKAMKATNCESRRSTSCSERERELAEQLFALRLQKVTGQLEKPARVRAGAQGPGAGADGPAREAGQVGDDMTEQ